MNFKTDYAGIRDQRERREAFWMPFTANRQFKHDPRLLVAAEGMYYTDIDGRKILDGVAGLWCCNAGHGRSRIVEAIRRQSLEMDFAPTFMMGHPLPFEFANRLCRILPGDIDHVFFTNSGSESVDTALKIALAYHRARGEGARQRLIGRERGYHGVGFGGISVGGLGNNRKAFGTLIPGTDHLRHTLDLERNAFSRGLPAHGVELAEDLARVALLHDASTIAAVIVEPIAGSAGVILPPEGYLKRLREICDQLGILLIFDEVITGFGRTGSAFGADEFEVLPDLITTAKGLTSGTVPMGAVGVRRHVYDAFMEGPENLIELFHGYTYSGHPLACAAGIATLEIYREEGLLERARELAPQWEEAVHGLRDHPHVIDLRNYGLIAGIELEPRAGQPTARAFQAHVECFKRGLLVRFTGDTVALSPPLIIKPDEIEQIFAILGDVLETLD